MSNSLGIAFNYVCFRFIKPHHLCDSSLRIHSSSIRMPLGRFNQSAAMANQVCHMLHATCYMLHATCSSHYLPSLRFLFYLIVCSLTFQWLNEWTFCAIAEAVCVCVSVRELLYRCMSVCVWPRAWPESAWCLAIWDASLSRHYGQLASATPIDNRSRPPAALRQQHQCSNSSTDTNAAELK